MAEEKKHVAMVRCEFGDEKGFQTSSDIDCNGIQLLLFVGKTLEIAANLLDKSPEYVANTALLLGKFSTPVEAESENGEES